MAHDTDYYTLGRGVLSIAEFSAGAPGTYQDVGNCPRLELTVSEEKLEHYSSRSGLRTKDKTVTLEVGYTVNFDLDEISRSNLAKFVKGSLSGVTVKGLKGTDKTYALKFVTNNATGKNYTWYFWKGTLAPESAMGLISDDWAVMSFTFEGESDDTNHLDNEYFQAMEMTTTTT